MGYDKKITNMSRNQHTTAATIISKYGEQFKKIGPSLKISTLLDITKKGPHCEDLTTSEYI